MKRPAFTIALILAIAGAARGQDSTDVAGIENAAATYIARFLLTPGKTVAFDSYARANNGVQRVMRPQARTSELAKKLGANRTGKKDEFFGCASSVPSTCRVRGVSTLVTIGQPVFQSGAAFITIDMLTAMENLPRVPVLFRGTTLQVEKRGANWVVIRTAGQSIS